MSDSGNHTIRKITPAGVVSTLAGSAGVAGSADGIGATARFALPGGVATDRAGNVYVADNLNNTIRKITPAGVVSTLAGAAGVAGSADGTGATASFYRPVGIATDSADNVYVADAGNSIIRKITPAGVVSTLAGLTELAGVTGSGIATDGAGNVYVTDPGHNVISKITPTGVVSTLAGRGGVYGSTDGAGAAARFYMPEGIATDSASNVYEADSINNTIRKITPDGVVSTLAGTAWVAGSADGTEAAATFNRPQGIAADSVGNAYVADSGNNTIRKITPAGVVSTLAGAALAGGSTDGFGTAARFNYPQGIAADSAGNVYVADSGNNTIRKITPGGVVSTLAGAAGVYGRADGIGAAASFSQPQGIATDSAGNVYVADTGNSTIRKITPDGVVSTLAGAAGVAGSTDGTGAAASINAPQGIATDSAGNVYVANSGNLTILKITPDGVVSTLTGSAMVGGSTDGTGVAARFRYPQGIATDSAGNVYVADSFNNTIRKVTPNGVVNTVVGVAGVTGFTPGSLPGVLSHPIGVAISGTSLYITTNNGVAVVQNVP